LIFDGVLKRFFDTMADSGGNMAFSTAIGRPSFKQRFPLALWSRSYGEKQPTGREARVL